MINGCAQLPGSLSKKDTTYIIFLPLVVNLKGWLAVPRQHATIHPSSSLCNSLKRVNLQLKSHSCPKQQFPVSGGHLVCLLCFCMGLLDINAYILEFSLYPSVFVANGFEFFCQPGDLFMEHVKVCNW